MPLHEIIFAVLCFAVCLWAIALGGAPERVIACAFLIAFIATYLLRTPALSRYTLVEWRVASIDLLLLGVVLPVGCFSTRYWGIPMGSMQILDVLGHLVRVLDPATLPQAYYVVVAFISYPMLVLLGVGVARHRARLRRFGRDFAWVGQLPSAYRQGSPADEATMGDS